MLRNESNNSSLKQVFKSIIKVILLGVLLAIAFRKLNIGVEIINQLSLTFLIISMALYFLWQFSIAYRWKYCIDKVSTLRRENLLKTLIRIIFVGNLVSISLIPSMIGQDTVKLLKWKEISPNLKLVVQSLLITRVAGLLGVIFCGILSIPGILKYGLVTAINSALNFNLYFYTATLFCFLLSLILLLIISLFLKEKIRKNIKLLCETLQYLDWRIIFLGIIAQILFILSSTCALLSVKDIAPNIAVVVSGFSSLGRILPLSFLGFTPGEGIQFFMLLNFGWGVQEITVAIGILIIFLYLTAVIGFFMESFSHFVPLKSASKVK